MESLYDIDGSREVEINYSYWFELGSYNNKRYVKAVYPYVIDYGNNKVEFVMEPRLDHMTAQGTSRNPQQPLTAFNRVRKVVISTLNQPIRSYTFEYDYGWIPSKHNDTNENNTADNISEIKSGQVIHSLLQKITPWSGNPDSNNQPPRPTPTPSN